MKADRLRLKRIYESPSKDDGLRILVDRLWPRGTSKEKAGLDAWMRELAPSNELRKEFCHVPERWEEFREAYWAELDENLELVVELRELIGRQTATLLFATKEERFNNAVALREYLLQD